MASPESGRTRVVLPWAAAPKPLAALARVVSRRHPFLRFAAGGPRDLTRWSFLACDPDAVLCLPSVTGSRGLRGRGGRGDGRGGGGGVEAVWRLLARRWPRRVSCKGPSVPFGGGWAGVLGYELRSAVERTPPPRRSPLGFPVLFLAHYDAVLAWDRWTGRAYLCGQGASAASARRAAVRLRALLEGATASWDNGSRNDSPISVRSPADYRRRVAEAKRRIRRGDFFQANLSQRFEGRLAGSPLGLFERLVATSPTPFATYVDLGEGRYVLSTSPERFVSLVGDRAETRPMKGTRPRGADPRADARHRADLLTSAKERAELAMIVDLSRNDLGRVCRPGTVRVAVPRRLERYATVHQAVGVVTGRLARGAGGIDLVRAAFPPGSVTGAPKVEAMRTIDDLEGEGRGPYCGAIGWLDEGGDLDLAVAIRTVLVAGRRVSYRVGGGVTLLSDPEEERKETLDKGRAMARAISGGGNGGRGRRRASVAPLVRARSRP